MTKKSRQKFLHGKSKSFGNFLGKKSKLFWPGSTTPQISNQIDAAASTDLRRLYTISQILVKQTGAYLDCLDDIIND